MKGSFEKEILDFKLIFELSLSLALSVLLSVSLYNLRCVILLLITLDIS